MSQNSAARSAVRKELDAFREAQLPPLKVPGVALLWHVLVEPLRPSDKFVGSELAKAESTVHVEELLMSVGKLVQLGHYAFKSKTTAGIDLAGDPNLPKVGDYVMFNMYAGADVRLRSGRVLKLLTDTEILMRVDDPHEILAYR